MPNYLRLVSLTILDAQDSDAPGQLDELRFRVVLDGHPVRLMSWSQRRSEQPTRLFTEAENKTDAGEWFTFWSTADLIASEEDNTTVPQGVLDDVDEWIQTVRLDHPVEDEESEREGVHTIQIGKATKPAYLSPGRTDSLYELTYQLTPFQPGRDRQLEARIASIDNRSKLLNDATTRGNLARDKGDCRWICAIDGGGLRGIFPLRMLEQMEAYYGVSCFDMFDMFAGTSTGSIISALLASGRSLKDIISLYTSQEMRERLFLDNSLGQEYGLRYFDLRGVGDRPDDLDDSMHPNKYVDMVDAYFDLSDVVRMVSKFLIAPRYRKTGMKELLHQMLSTPSGDRLDPLRLRDCKKDIMITARDMVRAETTFFTSFHIPYAISPPVALERSIIGGLGGPRTPPIETANAATGTYRNAYLKDAVEASASAPVYFGPRGRFSDGGIGPHNNPSFRAAVEALRYSHVFVDNNGSSRELPQKYKPYKVSGTKKSGTVVWSFGTSYAAGNQDADADMQTSISGSFALAKRTDTALYWVSQVIDSLMYGANQEQEFLCRELLKGEIKYLRLNLGLNRETLQEFDVDGGRDEILAAIRLDAVDPKSFEMMDNVARQFARMARDAHFDFAGDGFQFPEGRSVGIASYAAEVIRDLKRYE